MTRRLLVGGLVGVLLVALGLRFWPHERLAWRVPLSTDVWSADGELLRVTRASDDQFRLWVPLSEVSPTLIEAVLLKEDRWFYVNPGINPVALIRAALHTYRGNGRQGGSTVTMQVARMVFHMNTRTVSGKVRQIGAALWLEARYSKHEILETYLNVVPFGGNLEGVGAASQIYFGKTPDRLSLGEALTLAVIPQRPATRAGKSSSEQSLASARAQLARAWLARHGDDGGSGDARRQLDLPIVARPRFGMPYMPHRAPHFVDAVLAANPERTGRVGTTLNSRLQGMVERQIGRYLTQYEDKGIRNVSSLLVDARDMSIKAWVGSADYWNEEIDGQVNGVLAKRSPGSTLKPFVYALALDQGVLHPQTIVRDLPTSFGPFAPENFDGRFFGPISAETALVRSRNVPAVWVSSQLKQPSLYQFLQSAGIRNMKSESFYGLALALGGGEVTMEELAGLYAMLANQGVLRPLKSELTPSSKCRMSNVECRVQSEASEKDGVRLLSSEAAFITIDMLRNNQRPDEDGTVPVRTRWPVAWKTGTSWGFRDAWSAGIVGPYVLVVWIGDFRGQGNPAFIGVDAAAPLFFRIADALNLAHPDEAVPPLRAPAGVSRVAVCIESGELPNRDCPHTIDTWYIPGKSPIRVSQLHRAVALDAVTGRPVCPPYAAGTRFDVFEFWSSDMLHLFRQAGMPRRTPPTLPACASDDTLEPPRISSPLRNVSYAVHKGSAQGAITLEASTAADVRRLFWFDGSALIGVASVADGAMAWRPTTSGIHLIRIVDDHGRSAERDVEVEFTR
ncbi:MAG TPA: penicillin-binding protein 1C [Vicinamibacterales bacterium]|nr:penicillin-binding protein 1C [Vicinamibacterales bacterium]